MALKFKVKSKDEVPADHASLYVEREGAWSLDVEGAVEKAKLDEFRNTNVALLKERDDLKKRFEGIDPDEVRKLADEKRKLEEAQALRAATTAGEVEKVVEARVKAVKIDLDKQLSAASSERDALNARLTAIEIDQAVVTEATKRGLRARTAQGGGGHQRVKHANQTVPSARPPRGLQGRNARRFSRVTV